MDNRGEVSQPAERAVDGRAALTPAKSVFAPGFVSIARETAGARTPDARIESAVSGRTYGGGMSSTRASLAASG